MEAPLEALVRVTKHLEHLEKLVSERVVALEEANGELAAARDDLARAYSEAVRINCLKDEFVAIASHELRTPLTAIKGFALLLDDEQATMDEVREAARVISSQTDRLVRILDDVLDVARIESGTLPITVATVDVGEVFERTAETMRLKHGDREFDFQGRDLQVTTDEGKFEQILLNLIDNACKYAAPASPIQILARAVGDGIEVDVHNDGPGLSAQEQEAVFAKFSRLERTREETEGLGLGLYITQSLVQRLGGSIRIESSPGTGVTIVFGLPNLPLPQARAPEGSAA